MLSSTKIRQKRDDILKNKRIAAMKYIFISASLKKQNNEKAWKARGRNPR